MEIGRKRLPPIGKEPCEKCGGKIVIISDYHPLCAKHYVESLDLDHLEMLIRENNELIYNGAMRDVLIEIKKIYPKFVDKYKAIFKENKVLI